LYRLAKLAGGSVMMASSGDTSGILGVVQAGAGTTGNARIATRGSVTCEFDGGTTAGDYVTISTSAAGKCADAGSVRPASQQILGFATTTNGGPGAYTVILEPDAVSSNGGGSGDVTAVGECPAGACYQSVGQNQVLAGPVFGGAGAARARALVPDDIPTLNQNTTGKSSNVSMLLDHLEWAYVAGLSTAFSRIGSSRSPVFTSAEASVQLPVPEACTFSRLYITTGSAQPADGALTVMLRRNTEDTPLSVVIGPNSSAGIYSDTLHNVSFEAGDTFDLKWMNASISGSAQLLGISVKVQ
jgi:hypothetical protein